MLFRSGNPSSAQAVLEDSRPEVTITKEEKLKEVTLVDGHFTTPLAQHLPELCPQEVKTAHFQAVLPRSWSLGASPRPMVLQFAGTGGGGG